MTGILIQETCFNVSENYTLFESDVFESFTDSVDELFLELQNEFGLYVNKLFEGDDDVNQVGWVFQKKGKCEDSGEKFVQETWVTLHEKLPVKKVEYHFKSVSD